MRKMRIVCLKRQSSLYTLVYSGVYIECAVAGKETSLLATNSLIFRLPSRMNGTLIVISTLIIS